MKRCDRVTTPRRQPVRPTHIRPASGTQETFDLGEQGAGSGVCSTTLEQKTPSNVASGNGVRAASAARTRGALAAASPTLPTSRSAATTSAPDSASIAAHQPGPQPKSSTRFPASGNGNAGDRASRQRPGERIGLHPAAQEQAHQLTTTRHGSPDSIVDPMPAARATVPSEQRPTAIVSCGARQGGSMAASSSTDTSSGACRGSAFGASRAENLPKILYIGGTGRTGSTVLEKLLGTDRWRVLCWRTHVPLEPQPPSGWSVQLWRPDYQLHRVVVGAVIGVRWRAA